MIILKRGKEKEAQRKVDELMKIVRWMDDYRVFRVADPKHIEASIQRLCPSYLLAKWKRVKKDITAMNEALIESPLRKLIAVATIMRLVAMTSIMGFIVLFMVVAFFRVSLKFSYPAFVALVLLCLVIVPNSYLYLDRYVRIRIREYYRNLESRFAPRIEKVKDFAQDVIFYINDVIREYGLNPDKNKFRLRHCDYEGVVLVKKQRFSRLFTVKPLIK